MKKIKFKLKSAQRIYDNYIKRSKSACKILSQQDRDEILMEINSHIFESMEHAETDDEVDNLLNTLDTLGEPEIYLKPQIADLKIKQATKTFNPIHVFQALILNIKNGIIYSILGLLYLSLSVFVFIFFAKIFDPSRVGLFWNEKVKVLGYASNAEGTEILGYWFLPIIILVSSFLYLLITLILKFTNRK